MKRTLIAIVTLALLLMIGFIATSEEETSAPIAQSEGQAFPDRSTPQAAITTFLEAADYIAAQMERLEKERVSSHAWLYPQLPAAEAAIVEKMRQKMLNSLDLEALPDWIRLEAGTEAGLKIREILHYTGVTPSSALVELGDGRFLISGTYMQLSRMQAGLHAGDYLFNGEAVDNASVVYDSIAGARKSSYFDAYRYYSDTPGNLLPPRWAGLILLLPQSMNNVVFDNTVWQWSAFGLVVIAVVLVVVVMSLFGSARNAAWLFLQLLATAALAKFAGYFLVEEINLTAEGESAARLFSGILFFVALAGVVFLITEVVVTNAAGLLKINRTSLGGNLLRLACRVAGTAAALSVLTFGASQGGVPVMGIIAGLGVGGLAVALAAQPTLENLLAGIVLFTDRVFSVGDYIETEDVSGNVVAGNVEEIGMRSTKLRGSDGSLISITNSELASKIVKNTSRRIPA